MGSNTALEASAAKSDKKQSRKKRKQLEAGTVAAERIVDTNEKEAADGADLDENEPTMAEKLASLGLVNGEIAKTEEMQEPAPAQPPSADSVHVLLKQALHADDRALLLDCLYNQDQKVITNSVALLSPSDIFKLLDSLLSIIHSRGAVLACALPWLRSLLLQHASRITSQKSSLVALNSLYQLIESRVSTFHSAVQLSSCLDTLYAGMAGDASDDDEAAAPVIYNDDDDDDDESEAEESENAMETDDEDADDVQGSSDVSDGEGSLQMSE